MRIVRVFDTNWIQIEEYLRQDDRVIPRDLFGLLDAEQVRAAAPDGMLGGACARPDEDMKVVWDAGVAEVRALLENGWAR